MCGRIAIRKLPDGTNNSPWHQYWQDLTFGVPRYNLCPSESALVLRAQGESYEWTPLKWGFKPTWSKYNPAINAKAENILSSKMFGPSIRHRRCLVTADGFYEPKGPSSAKSRPWHFFHFEDDRLFGLAGIWLDEGFTIITCEPNALVSPIHERMPLIVEPEHWERWLDPKLSDETELSYLLQAREYPGMIQHRVGAYAKKPGNEGPRCIEAVADGEEDEQMNGVRTERLL